MPTRPPNPIKKTKTTQDEATTEQPPPVTASSSSAAAATGAGAQGGENNPEDIDLDAAEGGDGGADDAEGDIRIVQREVPSAVFGSAKEVGERVV